MFKLQTVRERTDQEKSRRLSGVGRMSFGGGGSFLEEEKTIFSNCILTEA